MTFFPVSQHWIWCDRPKIWTLNLPLQRRSLDFYSSKAQQSTYIFDCQAAKSVRNNVRQTLNYLAIKYIYWKRIDIWWYHNKIARYMKAIATTLKGQGGKEADDSIVSQATKTMINKIKHVLKETDILHFFVNIQSVIEDDRLAYWQEI